MVSPHFVGIKDFHGADLKLLRMATGKVHRTFKGAPRWSDHDVLGMAAQPDASVLLASHRLRYLQRVLLHGPDLLLARIQCTRHCDHTFGAMVIAYLVWLQGHCHKRSTMPSPQEDLPEWLRFVAQAGKKRNCYIHDTVKAAGKWNAIQYQARAFHRDICEEAGPWQDPDATPFLASACLVATSAPNAQGPSSAPKLSPHTPTEHMAPAGKRGFTPPADFAASA